MKTHRFRVIHIIREFNSTLETFAKQANKLKLKTELQTHCIDGTPDSNCDCHKQNETPKSSQTTIKFEIVPIT